MKRINKVTFLNVVILLFLTTKSFAINYLITFTGSGASTSVDSVIVKNLTKGSKIKLNAGNVLNLSDVVSSVNYEEISEGIKVIYNPAQENLALSFFTKQTGIVSIIVSNIDGKILINQSRNLNSGKNSFELSLPQGVYIAKVKGNNFSYTSKVLTNFSSDKIAMKFTGNEMNRNIGYPKRIINSTNEISMDYTPGDQMLYEGHSGNNTTILSDAPTESKDTSFYFVECKDYDNNYYPVVIIGSQIWMAENLRTTKCYIGGSENIKKVTDNAVWISFEENNTPKWCDLNNDEANGLKYGHLYSWIVTMKGGLIQGWNYTDDKDWKTLIDFVTEKPGISGSAAKALATTTEWRTSTTPGSVGYDILSNNSSGFSALPVGMKLGDFANFSEDAYWWCSEDYSFFKGVNLKLNYNFSSVNFEYWDLNQAYSIRCVSSTIPPNKLPVLTTETVTSITTNSAVCGGSISDDHGEAITARGICWDVYTCPTKTANWFSSDGMGTGTFSSVLTGLMDNTTYYVRAYAINSKGIMYGEEKTFRTLTAIKDIDGNEYHSVTIGTQTWMVENLRTTRYRNGVPIGNVSDNTAWGALTTGAWCDYNNEATNGSIYGHLYNWYAVNDSRKIAPLGWHVASHAEWTTLKDYLIANGYNYDGSTSIDKTAKSLSAKILWASSENEGAIGNDLTLNNSSGFSALPGGFRMYDGSYFNHIGFRGFWWSSTELSLGTAWYRSLYQYINALMSNAINENYGYSVRCIKD